MLNSPPPKKMGGEGSIFKSIFIISWGLALLFMLVSIAIIYSGAWTAHFSQLSYPYFFILLLEVPILPVSDVILIPAMFSMYILFFGIMVYYSFKWKGRGLLDNPVIFYGAMSAFALTVTVILTLILEGANIPIGGSSLTSLLNNHPFETYLSLIYAPFAEETGFRLIPLGIMSVLLLSRYHPEKLDYLKAFFIPGHMRKKYNQKFGYIEYAMIAATSILFAYAHVAYGLWSWGKIITVLPVAVVLAVGFLKFGIYMDVPIHWLFNGFSTVYILNGALTEGAGFALFYELIAGFAAIVFLLILYRKWDKRRNAIRSENIHEINRQET
ncbi:MAG: CPBP family glutamic-type intramembrane protease [Candidatus Thermoplasmatota archaeon]|jgi:membrane protease YdiL (CAAX protease family)|nr:CPBP family glutamic-type intramembrane protease [Candidatus Thermoplasmatota archaeon]